MSQLTLNFEPTMPERFKTLREYVAFLSMSTTKLAKTQASDMDISPSTLARKLNPADGDTQRFNLDDLEAWLSSTGEAERVLAYLGAKFLDSDDSKKARLLSKAQTLMSELTLVLPALRESA